MIYVFIAFFPGWNDKLDCRHIKAEVRIFPVDRQISFEFHLLCQLKLLNLHTVVFRQYQKKLYCHTAFISRIVSLSKCLEFNFNSLFIFLSKCKALSLIETIEMCNVCIITFKKLHESSVSFKTINTSKVHMNSLHYFMVIMNDNVQQQFIYLIVVICRNTLRSILSQFL